MSLRVLVARVRPVVVPLGVLLVLAGITGLAELSLVGAGVLLSSFVLDRVRPPTAPVRVVASPVTGRWRALNSPASAVPSHGTNGLGQTWAIDLVGEDDAGSRPEFGRGGQWRLPTDYPAFGRPILSPLAGTVGRVHDRRRDHRARSGWWSVLWMLVVEGFVRQVAGVRWMLGNHVVVVGDDGLYAVLAHLRRGSVAVVPGDRVQAGQPVAQCGNSGNSSEPHLHVQLTDSARIASSCGVPMAVRDGAADGSDGLPANGELLGGEPVSAQ